MNSRPRKIIGFRGRAGDRAEGHIAGAVRLASHLADRFGLDLQWIGVPAPPARDGWSDALEAARPELEALAQCVRAEVTAGFMPVCVLPTDAAAIAVHAAAIQGDPDTTLAWFDAHADFHTPRTTESGFLGGMALAAACALWDSGFGRAVTPEQVLLVGARAIDPPEQRQLDRHAIARVPADREAAARVAAAPLRRRTFVHLDLDCLEPGHVPVAYREDGGLLPDEVRASLRSIAGRSQVMGLVLSEFYEPTAAESDTAALDLVGDMILPLVRA